MVKQHKSSKSSDLIDLEVVRVQLKPAWTQNEVKRRLWWTLIGLAEKNIDHPVSIAIHRAARSRLVGSLGYNISGTAWDLEASSNRVDRSEVSRIVEPGGRTRTERYGVLLGSLSFLSSQGVTVHADMDDDLIMVSDDQNSNDPSEPTTRTLTAIDGVYAGAIFLSKNLSLSTVSGPGGKATTAFNSQDNWIIGPSKNAMRGSIPQRRFDNEVDKSS